MNDSIIVGKIIDKELIQKFLNLGVDEVRYLKCAGNSKVDGYPIIIINKSTIRKAKIDDIYSEDGSFKMTNVEREIITYIVDKNIEKIEFIEM